MSSKLSKHPVVVSVLITFHATFTSVPWNVINGWTEVTLGLRSQTRSFYGIATLKDYSKQDRYAIDVKEHLHAYDEY